MALIAIPPGPIHIDALFIILAGRRTIPSDITLRVGALWRAHIHRHRAIVGDHSVGPNRCLRCSHIHRHRAIVGDHSVGPRAEIWLPSIKLSLDTEGPEDCVSAGIDKAVFLVTVPTGAIPTATLLICSTRLGTVPSAWITGINAHIWRLRSIIGDHRVTAEVSIGQPHVDSLILLARCPLFAG